VVACVTGGADGIVVGGTGVVCGRSVIADCLSKALCAGEESLASIVSTVSGVA
jgi:hypothetical protein